MQDTDNASATLLPECDVLHPHKNRTSTLTQSGQNQNSKTKFQNSAAEVLSAAAFTTALLARIRFTLIDSVIEAVSDNVLVMSYDNESVIFADSVTVV